MGMRPRRCAQERDCTDALTSRSRVASPQAGPLLRRTRAHLAVVRALPDADFAGFPSISVCSQSCKISTATLREIVHELAGQDTRSIGRKTREIGVRQGANHSQVRPRTAEQRPRLRGCDPGAGCKRSGSIAFLCIPTRSHPNRGTCSTLRCAHLARIRNAAWRRTWHVCIDELVSQDTK